VKVALDARTMQVTPPGGIGRGLYNLLPFLTQALDVVLLTDSKRPPVQGPWQQVPLRTPLSAVSATWLQLSAPPWLRRFEGVFHCPFYALPWWLPSPGVVTLHDLSFEHLPQLFSTRHRHSFRLQARHAARVAGCVLTPSEYVRRDVISTYDVEPARVLVAPNAVDPVFEPDAGPAPTLERLGVTRPYVVALGGAPRRNLSTAVQAWRRATRDHDLVVVGAEQPDPEPGLHWAGVADDKCWAGILAGAEAFLYPTGYEGYGMPGIEALAAGAPVVAARVGALPEVLGPGALWAESVAVEDVAVALGALLADEPRRQALRAAGLLHANAAPGWVDSAAVHLTAYAMAADRG
jgi:glycosyltransferase involved in cell wall biosynthesis